MTITKTKKVVAVIFAILIAFTMTFAISSCGKSEEEEVTTDPSELQTLEEGKLTIATGEPAWAPWVIDDDPASGKGYEAAIAYAVAEKLGFAKEDVVWVRTGFDEAIKPGAKNFDFNLQQFTITEEREKIVDFSTPYYKAPLTVIVDGKGKFADAKSIADLKDAVFAAPQGDIAGEYIESIIAPTNKVQILNNLSDVFAALKTGQIDATVQGAVTANYNVNIDNAQIPNAKIIGNLPNTEEADPFGLLLEKNSPLTEKVSAAVDELWKDGTIDKLKGEYLSDYDFTELS